MIFPGIYASQISGHLFTLTGSYDALASVTVPSGGVSSVTFAGIPTGYSHLQIRAFARSTESGSTNTNAFFQFNGDTGSNYSEHQLAGDGSSASASGAASQVWAYTGLATGNSSSSNMYGAFIVDVLDYANGNKNKTIKTLSGNDQNGSGYVLLRSGAWYSTSAISSIVITPGGGSWQQYSSFALYGVK
jgi:hypothetical protein